MATSRQRRAARGQSLDKRIENILHDKLAHFLSDIDFRLGQAYDVADRASGRGSKVYAEDMNIPGRHFLTGYTVTSNSPTAGSIAWANLHMVYNGTDTLITDGNSALTYHWWSPTTTPTVLQSSNTKPTLANGEVLLFMNVGGAAKVMLSDTNASLPSLVANNTVDASAINGRAIGQGQMALNAVDSSILASNAVTAGKIATGAINAEAQFATGVVGSTALGANAVTAGKIAAGGISASTQFASGVVTSTAIGADQITSALIAPSAVGTTELGANAVDSTKLADGAVSTTAKIGTGVVTATNVAAGAVTPAKLNILRHVLY